MSDELNTPLGSSPGIDPLSIPDVLGPAFKLQLIALINYIGTISQRASTAGQTAWGGQEAIQLLKERTGKLENDSLSKSDVEPQSLVSSLGVVNALLVDGVKVTGPRQTGWTAATGTALPGAFNANQAFTVSNPPTQAEIQTIADALIANRQRTKALEDALRTHGLIN